MKLPNDEIGISDVLAYRDCPRRFSFSMKRHMPEGEPPEAAAEHAYGSCIHDVLSGIEEKDLDNDKAVQLAFDKWGWALDPDDMTLIQHDIETYYERDILGVSTLANEGEFRVPLLQHEGRTIYFRFRIDRLYQRLDNPATFVMVDYKSSKHRKSEAEVHSDLQMWAYNWGIFTFYPECETLVQVYDQLRFGTIPTNKSEEQRAQFREWLERQVRTILADDEVREKDGLMEPRLNKWCAYCPIKMDCPIIDKLSDFAATRIAALAPDADAVAKMKLDPDAISEHTERLEEVGTAIKTLQAYEKTVKGVVKELPMSQREDLGFKLTNRRSDTWDPQAMRAVHEMLGDSFYGLVGITKARLDEMFPDEADDIKALARTDISGEQLRRTT